ncbi:hypothetical protein [Longispora albida]|uniref:hypothetical protein n=1 Tax=Longispora albida TaxID=203523 RepID=UPI000377FF48|nr:hypothetical protein [Longispora albida]
MTAISSRRIVRVTHHEARDFAAAHGTRPAPLGRVRFHLGVLGADGELLAVAVCSDPLDTSFDDGVTAQASIVGDAGLRARSLLLVAVWERARRLGYRRFVIDGADHHLPGDGLIVLVEFAARRGGRRWRRGTDGERISGRLRPPKPDTRAEL